jgi:thiol-disulfide isomerase/thioredoxin
VNFQSHLTNVRTLVDLLRRDGIAADDIVIFSSDGSDPTPDLATRDTDRDPDAWLLPAPLAHLLRPVQLVDSTVDGFTLQPATNAALQDWFDREGRRLHSGDTLLLYVTDHGEPNRKDPANNTIVLWHDSLSVDQLRGLLGELDPGVRVVMLMSQCYSGSFANVPFASPDALQRHGDVCGYFASTADRPAYGCYPENRGRDGVGHSHQLFTALNALGRMPEAENRLLASDDTPDVPNTTSDFYLHQLLARQATRDGRQPAEVADDYIRQAFHTRAAWEPEIRLLDRVGSTFGMFSPRSLSELDLQTMMLPQVSTQLRTYAERWSQSLEALKEQNFNRFLTAQPEWRPHLTPAAVQALDDAERRTETRKLVDALAAYTAADAHTSERLHTLKQRADAASAAAYRMEVRLGVVLRMRALLEQVAGRTYLQEHGGADERDTYAALRACEDVAFTDAPPVQSAALMDPPPKFPPLEDDRQVVDAVMPAWMGISFTPLASTSHKNDHLAPGAVAVTHVYPDSAAERAGLQIGDIILGPPGQPFLEPTQVREWTMQREIGEPAPLSVVRAGHTREVTLRPEPFPLKMPDMPGPPQVGNAAPPLKLDPFRGDHTFAAGHPRLLFFWATWCAPCKASLPEVMAFAAARGVEVVAITDEDPDTLKAFFTQFKQPFPETVGIDPYRTAYQSYGVSGTPTFVLLDAGGVVRYYHTGYDAQKGLGIEGWTYAARERAAAH